MRAPPPLVLLAEGDPSGRAPAAPLAVDGVPTGQCSCGDAGPGAAPVLIVEADRDLGRAIVRQLTADGYRAELARSAGHARILAGASGPRLAVLGGFDPPRGAIELLGEIRRSDRPPAPWEPELPTIVLGDQAEELDLLRAFEAGADDYISRSAPYLELRARIRAILRRAAGTTREHPLRVGPLSIDPIAHIVTVSGKRVDLRRLEFDLLLHLSRDPRRVFSKDELLRTVWGYRSSGSTRTLDSHASRLRRKLEFDGAHRWVVNVWGIGYRLI